MSEKYLCYLHGTGCKSEFGLAVSTVLLFFCRFVEDTARLRPTVPKWNTRTDGRERWQVPPFHLKTRGEWTEQRWAHLKQKMKQRFSSEGQTLRTVVTGSGLGSVGSWGVCRFFCSFMCCKGFLWDWQVASLWSCRVKMSATQTKLSSALSSGRLVSSFSGHHWWILFTTAGLVEGKKDLCLLIMWMALFFHEFLMKSMTLPTSPTRKSWLVPTQYLLGLFLIYLSLTVNSLLQSEGGPRIVSLTAVFFMLAFLAATQVATVTNSRQIIKSNTRVVHLSNVSCCCFWPFLVFLLSLWWIYFLKLMMAFFTCINKFHQMQIHHLE